MTVPPDSYQISLSIIEVIKQHPVLYCTEVKGGLPIKLQEFKQKVWKRISNELGLDPTWVRVKWKNLRDTYCRVLKCKNKSEEGRRKKWIFEDHLNFMKFPFEADYEPLCIELTEEYMQEINSNEVSSEGLLEQLEDRNNEDYSEYMEILEETSADPVQMVSETVETLDNNDDIQVVTHEESERNCTQQDLDNYVEQIQSKYRKIRPKRIKTEHSSILKTSNSNSTKKSLKVSNVSIDDTGTVDDPSLVSPPSTSILPVKGSSGAKNNDAAFDSVYLAPENRSIELFFDSMAQTVKKLPPKAQADIKMHICKLVSEAEVKYSGQNMPQSMQQFIAPPGMIPKLVLIPCNMIDNQETKD